MGISNCSLDDRKIMIAKAEFMSNINENGTAGIRVSSKCRLHLEGVLFVNNLGTIGPAIDIFDGAEVVVSTSIFEANRASRDGGAIHVHGSAVFVSWCNFTKNIADSSGGVIAAKVSEMNSTVFSICIKTGQR